MADISPLLEEQLSQVGKYVMQVDMFPVFLTAHFSLSCLLVREDSKDLGTTFRQDHPFTSWLCTIITALSGVFVANFLFGYPLIEAVSDNTSIVFITVLWYLVNYSPFDVVYKIVTFTPVFLSASCLQECLRARFIYLGIQQSSNIYPGSYLAILMLGVINGNGYGLIKIVERLIRGKWTPTSNELLDVTYFSKSGMYASVLFLLQNNKLLQVPIELLYLGVVITFITFRLMIITGDVQDPLLRLETPICSFLFGSGSVAEDSPTENGRTQKSRKD